MEENKVCTTCAGKLEFNTLIGFYECTACGKIYSVTEDLKPVSLASVSRLMLEHNYDEAHSKLQTLISSDPDNVMLHLHSLLCKRRAVSTNQLLVAASNSDEQIRQVKDDSDWDKIRTMNGGRGSKLTELVQEYCDDQLKMSALRRKYGPEIESGTLKDIPAPNEKKIKTIHPFFIFLISLIFWSGVVISIGLLIASANNWFFEDWSRSKGYYVRLKNDNEFGMTVGAIIVVLTFLSVKFLPVIRKRRLKNLAKSGKIRFLKDGTPVKVTSKIVDQTVYIKPDQAAIREYRDLRFRCEKIIEEIRREESNLMTDF